MFRPFQFLATWRSLPAYELASYPLMFASVPMLAYGSRPYDATLLKIVVLTVVSLYAGFFAALIVNDVTDSDIDSIAHPDRPIPSGRVSVRSFALAAAAATLVSFALAFVISPWCLALVAVAMALSLTHNKYLKRSVPLPGYSELFGSTQWLVVGLFGYIAVWSHRPVVPGTTPLALPLLGRLDVSAADLAEVTLLAAFIYFVDTWHDIPEGICDAEGDRLAGVRTMSSSFGERAAVWITLGIFLVSGALGVALYLRTSLSLFFLLTFAGLFAHTAPYPLRLVRESDPERFLAASAEAGRKGFDYFLFCFDLIFLDLVLQRVVAAL